MKVQNYEFPQSSFLSIEKDTALIIKRLLNNERLKKLLYYNSADALSKPALTAEQERELIEKHIKIVPKLQIDTSIYNYIVISFDNFFPSDNPEFRDNSIIFDIICNFDTWSLADFQLRPYKIAGELDYLFNGQRLTGIGTLEFLTANQININEDYGILSLVYGATHGDEDKIGQLNPNKEQEFIKQFDEQYNR